MSDAIQPVLDFLAKTTKAPMNVESFGQEQVKVANFAGYPSKDVTTFVTAGASRWPVSMWRGLQVGFELTLTLAEPDPHTAEALATAVIENLKLADSRQRRPFIEANGIYAPGYAPHLMFTSEVSFIPKLTGRKRCGDGYVQFLSAVPLGDSELREYDRGVRVFLDKLKAGGQIEKYPRA